MKKASNSTKISQYDRSYQEHSSPLNIKFVPEWKLIPLLDEVSWSIKEVNLYYKILFYHIYTSHIKFNYKNLIFIIELICRR